MPRSNTISRAAAPKIGALSERTGVHIETIRYYERIGLLAAPARSKGNHRNYSDDQRLRLAFIRRARGLGFSLDQIRTLLTLARADGLACKEVHALTQHNLADVRHRIRDLRRLEGVLGKLAASCREGAISKCPILDALGRDTDLRP